MQLCTKAGGDERMKENVAARWREGEGPERRHPLARSAPLEPWCLRGGGRRWARRGRGGASQGRARRDRGGVGRVRVVWSGAERGRGGGVRESDVIERSGRKKGLTRVLYPLMFIGPTHQPINISYVRRFLNR
jgi:hypothetical protein